MVRGDTVSTSAVVPWTKLSRTRTAAVNPSELMNVLTNSVVLLDNAFKRPCKLLALLDDSSNALPEPYE